MKHLKYFVSFGFILAASNASFATEADGPCLSCAESQSTIKNSLSKIEQAIKPQDSYWVDASFLVDIKPVGKELDVVFKNPSDLNMSYSNYYKVSDVYSSFLSQKNLTDALKVVKTGAAGFSQDEKLLLLSMVGSRLSDGYSATGKENKDINSVYLNAVRSGSEGGVCGDIHKLLGEVAKNLGFEAVGRHTGQWQQDLDKDNAGGHAILHFRDPKTGEYYIQNYSQLYNTKQKTLQGAVDVSEKVLGVLTGQSYVEGRPGKLHEYVPATAQWVQDQIKNAAQFKNGQSVFTLKQGEHERTLAFQVGGQNVKGFMLSSRVNTDEGTYQLDAAGVSTGGEYSKTFKDRIIDEVKVTTNAYGGALRLSAPGFDAMSDTFKQGERSTFFFGGNLKGTARINNTTGKIEINSVNLDFRPKGGDQTKNTTAGTRTDVKAGLEHEWKDLNLKVSADRTWSFIPVDIEQKEHPHMQTTYDRVGVIYDTSNGNKKEAYLVVGTDVYFMEGINVSSAVAVKNSIKAVLPTEKLGTFTVAADLGKFVSNKSNDPFYETVPTTSVGIDWSKPLNKLIEVGANLTYTKGNQIQPFAVIGPITPVMGGTEKKVQGMVYLHGHF